MAAHNQLDDLVHKLSESLPQGLHELSKDLKKNLRTSLESGLSRLDLVTREEFELQTASLQRAREQLSKLEARLASLEAQLK